MKKVVLASVLALGSVFATFAQDSTRVEKDVNLYTVLNYEEPMEVVEIDDLPDAVVNTLLTEYSGCILKEATALRNSQPTVYLVTIITHDQREEKVQIDEYGTLID